jgi:DNA-binding response OmpR family regulator
MIARTHKHLILLVDDNVTNLKLAIEHLRAYQFEVVTARNGETGLARALEVQPDLILLDVQMPGLNGFEVCRRLKADALTAEIPVIFMTALADTEDKVRGLDAGGVDYVTKPFQMEEVIARIRTHLTLREMRQKLHEQNEQLQVQNYELDAFAHTVAHDLKNPVAALQASLALLQSDAQTKLNEEEQDILQLGIASVNKLESIIDELLVLASVRKEAVELEPINMREVIHQAVLRLSQLLDKYHPEIIQPESWPIVLGHTQWLEEVWMNYLSNAMKYGGRPPRLTLGATVQADGMVRCWVRDNGQTLSPEARMQLFTEFKRLDKIRANGHGLGLSIVRRIIEKLGGQYGVEAVAEGGSEFYFTLPHQT